MENRKRWLCLNRALAFIVFLCAFGKLCYEWGHNTSHDGFALLFLFPIFYLLLLVVSHWLVGAVFYTRKPYVIAASMAIGFISLMWIVYLMLFLGENASMVAKLSLPDVIYNCVITLISLAIGSIYFLLAFKFKDN